MRVEQHLFIMPQLGSSLLLPSLAAAPGVSKMDSLPLARSLVVRSLTDSEIVAVVVRDSIAAAPKFTADCEKQDLDLASPPLLSREAHIIDEYYCAAVAQLWCFDS